ncbi:carbohydrate-binding module family 18 protein [Hyaloscypha hepaticicola]|uniref:Carbohydrate-binding module family 18 protein n=1 Tax=Hyaloscypha hepaticicola TaxID=2082293 RepID=A0A2J6Q5U9_9HELO|nr:carbohydrate-binding module family 18 protein [Hyaloscypha hepaticicola]
MFSLSHAFLFASAALVLANPTVDISARDFSLVKRTNSPNGVCGGYNNTATCTGTAFGKCCSMFGYCGNTNAHCGFGCQSNFGTCGVTGPSVKWVSQGCYTDNPSKRTLRTALNVAQNSVEVCTAACAAQGFLYAGMENGNGCYCDNAISNGGVATLATSCTSKCAGNNAETCGGPSSLSLYTRAPATWQGMGCYTDIPNQRTLNTSFNVAALTQERCQATCQAGGFKYAGVENGNGCFCGSAIAATGAVAGDCALPCAGNNAEICGGVNRLNIFIFE